MALTQINEKDLEMILEYTPATQNIMIAGKHGIGKSQIVKEFFERRGKKVVTFFCSQASDPGDIIGLPHLNEVTGQTEFALPWWFPVDGQPVVLFLDVLNRARPEILQVVMDLTLNRKLAGKCLPEGSQIISAINDGDEYQLTDLDPALVSRFNVYRFSPSNSEWIKWATDHEVEPHVIGFLSINSSLMDSNFKDDTAALDKGPDRRAWERVSDVVKGYVNDKGVTIKPKYDLHLKKLLCGIVGGEAGVKFFEYIKSDNAIKPEDIIKNFEGCEATLRTFQVTEFVGLNDSLCSYINHEYEDGDEKVGKILSDGLMKYFTFLADPVNGNKEALAHFISNYESGAYINLNILITDYPKSLEAYITKFIIKTKTR